MEPGGGGGFGGVVVGGGGGFHGFFLLRLGFVCVESGGWMGGWVFPGGTWVGFFGGWRVGAGGVLTQSRRGAEDAEGAGVGGGAGGGGYMLNAKGRRGEDAKGLWGWRRRRMRSSAMGGWQGGTRSSAWGCTWAGKLSLAGAENFNAESRRCGGGCGSVGVLGW